jgi:hypothetical protein
VWASLTTSLDQGEAATKSGFLVAQHKHKRNEGEPRRAVLNPESAHLIASAGFGMTSSDTVAAVTPMSPTDATGIGSSIKGITTATNSAK